MFIDANADDAANLLKVIFYYVKLKAERKKDE